MVTLSRLFIHPVKSMCSMGLTRASTDISDLAFDRLFTVAETGGIFTTARQLPQMVEFIPAPLHDGFHLTVSDDSSAMVRFSGFAPQAESIEVQGNHFTALIVLAAVNQRLSGFFKHDVQSRWLGPQLTRRVKRHDAVPLPFADGYPYLLTNEALLRDLQQRCSANIGIEQLHSNLMTIDAVAWSEDSWKVIHVSEMVLDIAKLCSHCVFTTVSPERRQKHPTGEPLETSERFRTALDNGDVGFDRSLVAHNSGVIRVDDEVEILARGPVKAYDVGEGDNIPTPEAPQQATVATEWQGQQFAGNNRQVLLEQLGQQDVRIPYSCRIGICGGCRIRLEESEVSALRKNVVAGDGTILACSYVPKTALRLAP